MSATPSRVLIVGSGPTGLVLACELLTLGIPCRIIDRLSQPITTSRSFTIHARTLELLDKLGLVEEFLSRGHKSDWMEYHFQGKEETSGLNFAELNSRYPFCLIINQSETEAILREHVARLGGTIEWHAKLAHLEQADDQVTVTLEDSATGEQNISQVDWLIGCDGFHSTVRQYLNLPFDGEQFAGEMKMMDVEVTGFDYPSERIHFFITREHMLLVAKLPGKNYRVLISDTGQGTPTETAREAFQEVVDQHFQGRVQLGEPEWTTLFKIHRRRVDTYRNQHVLLAGDSAHINSPAGGQGMNVSMQDSFNLGWKLALVIKGQAHHSLIDSYEKERAPIAVQMQEGTQYIHNIILAHGSGIEERLALTRAPGWNRKAVNQVAGISYTYRSLDSTASLAAGDRAPDVQSGATRFYNLIDRAVPTLFLMLSEYSSVKSFTAMSALVEAVTSQCETPIAVRYLVSSSLAQQINPHETIIDDADGALRRAYLAFDKDRAYLIRPDRYIDFEASSADELTAHIQTHYAGQTLSSRES